MTLFRGPSRIHFLIFFSGLAALSWEVLWQIEAALALGISAWGTAIALAVTMGGMSIGALGMGHALKDRSTVRPLRLYAILEFLIGMAGLLLTTAFRCLEQLDTYFYAINPTDAPYVYLVGIALILAVPTICMGATLPVLGLAARYYPRTKISTLYGLNTLGAAAGTLCAAFLLIPLFGITGTTFVIAGVNVLVGLAALRLDRRQEPVVREKTAASRSGQSLTISQEFMVVCVTGFATFVLEVAWFRSLISAFRSSTDAFAIMLCSVLLALGVGAHIIPLLRLKKISLGAILCAAGILILLATPMVERFDIFARHMMLSPLTLLTAWLLMTIYTIGPAVLLLGVGLPWILDEQTGSKKWGLLYGGNTLAAIAGSLLAAWFLLPTIGFAQTAWLTGVLVIITGLVVIPHARRMIFVCVGSLALVIAVLCQSGVGTIRVQGPYPEEYMRITKVLAQHEGPDATIAVTEGYDGLRMLFINGFIATAQSGQKITQDGLHYMYWMGHLPMVLHPNPRKALVICFGTGQTANSVRQENPESLDIVDLNKQVFDLAPLFPANQNVLQDKRVNAVVMDGRAYMRRNKTIYDVITLEPMPPTFAGVNALYSQEFYKLARAKLGKDGKIAQWLPFHMLLPETSASIARTFQSVFPNSILWIDPASSTGILIGSADDKRPIDAPLPGYRRKGSARDMSEKEVRKAILFDPQRLQDYGRFGKIITDDNQALAYGKSVYMSRATLGLNEANTALLNSVAKKSPARH